MGLKTIQSNSFGKISRVIFELLCAQNQRKKGKKKNKIPLGHIVHFNNNIYCKISFKELVYQEFELTNVDCYKVQCQS